MMTQAGLIVWVVMGVFTCAIDIVMAYRRISGKLGEQVRATYAKITAMVGGVRNLLIISVIGDLFLWPFSLAACLYAWVRDWRIYQAELARSGVRKTEAS